MYRPGRPAHRVEVTARSLASTRGLHAEWATWFGCFVAFVSGGALLLFIAGFVLVEAWPALAMSGGPLAFLVTEPWAPLASPPRFGILHAWISTLMVTAICLALAVPAGYGIALFLSEIAPSRVRITMQPCLDLLAGIPSVVYGFFGYVTLVPWFERWFDMAAGESVLVAGLVLAVMVLPFVASTSVEAFRAVPDEQREAALAQGVTRWHMVRRVVLPLAAPGMFAGAALGLARAIGETLAVLMLTGNSVAVPTGPLDRGQPLTALIATELGEAGVGSAKFHALFGAALVLIIVTVAINILAWRWKGRLLRHG